MEQSVYNEVRLSCFIMFHKWQVVKIPPSLAFFDPHGIQDSEYFAAVKEILNQIVDRKCASLACLFAL